MDGSDDVAEPQPPLSPLSTHHTIAALSCRVPGYLCANPRLALMEALLVRRYFSPIVIENILCESMRRWAIALAVVVRVGMVIFESQQRTKLMIPREIKSLLHLRTAQDHRLALTWTREMISRS